MKLYGYWRSGTSYRVRIALNLKGLAYEHVGVHLVRDGGQHRAAAYTALNPQGRVPSLVLDDGTVLTQSPAILEWLEERHPEPALLPKDPIARAKVRAVAALIGCDIHPLGNVGPLNYLRRELKAEEPAVMAWIAHWFSQGMAAAEALVDPAAPFAFGDAPGMADLYIVPQVYSARRFKVPLEPYPRLAAIAERCNLLEAFRRAAPEAQPDAE